MTRIMTRNGKMMSRGGLVLANTRPEIDYVVIGNQRWMKKNLAIDDGEGGIYTQTVNYGHGDVTEYYYTWEAAVRVANSIPGWHLPSTEEFETLIETVGQSTAGTKLKSTYGWAVSQYFDGNGTDDYGFTGLPAGYYDSRYYDSIEEIGYETYFWTSTEYSSTVAYSYGLEAHDDDDEEMLQYESLKLLGFSVRLIKDVN